MELNQSTADSNIYNLYTKPYLINQKVCQGVMVVLRKSFERLIHILTYTTNIEFSETYRSFEIKDKIKSSMN